MSGDGPAGHGGVVVIRWVTKMSREACEGALSCGHKPGGDRNIAWSWGGSLWCGHRRWGDRNCREPVSGEAGMLGRLLKNVRLRCDWSLWWAVVGLATKMSRGAGEDHRGAGVDVRVAKIVRSDPGAHIRLRGGPLSVVVRKVARGWESSLWCSHRPCGDKIVVSQGLVRTGMLSWPLKNVR